MMISLYIGLDLFLFLMNDRFLKLLFYKNIYGGPEKGRFSKSKNYFKKFTLSWCI